MKSNIDKLREEDRCKTCKTGLHLYCPHEVELIKKHEREEILKDLDIIESKTVWEFRLSYRKLLKGGVK